MRKINRSMKQITRTFDEMNSHTSINGSLATNLPNGAKRRLRIEYNNSVNTRGKKGLPHMAADVMPKYRQYLAENDLNSTFDRFQGFLMNNTWDTKFGEMKGHEAYNKSIDLLVERMKDTLSGWGAETFDEEKIRDNCHDFIWYQVQTAYSGLLAERTAINAIAEEEGIMSFEVSETREEEAAGTDGRVGGTDIQVKHESYAASFEGDQALVTYTFEDDDRTSDKKVVITYDPAEIKDDKEEPDLPDYMLA